MTVKRIKIHWSDYFSSYRVNLPGDQSGEYVPAEEYDKLEKQVELLTDENGTLWNRWTDSEQKRADILRRIPTCDWAFEDDDWRTGCDKLFWFEDGELPHPSTLKFCSACGGRIGKKYGPKTLGGDVEDEEFWRQERERHEQEG